MGNTPLIVACQSGQMKVSKILLEYGADVNRSNSKRNCALHYCFNYGFEDIGKYLIDNGANEYATNFAGLTCYEGLTPSDLEEMD